MLSIVKKHSVAFVGLFLVIAILVVSATFFSASHAAAPTKRWSLAGGVNASSTGTIIFNNRSVQISGRVSDPGSSAFPNFNCATINFNVDAGSGVLSSTSRTVCKGTRTFGFSLPANVRGGASFVSVFLSTGGSVADGVELSR